MLAALIARSSRTSSPTFGVQRLVTRDHDRRRPAPGLDAEHPELDRQQRRVALGLGDVRVHAAHVGLDDRLAARVIAIELVVQVAAELVQPRAAIARQLAAAEDLRDRAGRLPPPDLELEQPIPRGGVALGEEQVGLRSARRCG